MKNNSIKGSRELTYTRVLSSYVSCQHSEKSRSQQDTEHQTHKTRLTFFSSTLIYQKLFIHSQYFGREIERISDMCFFVWKSFFFIR